MGRIRIARILGIPVYLHYTWFLIFGLVVWALSAGYFPAHYPDLPLGTYWAKGTVAALLLFASVLIHELSHSVVAMRSGIGIVSITLFIFGGVAQLREDPRHPRVELAIAIAGPLASLALAGLFTLLAGSGWGGDGVTAVTAYVARINVVLALFNLVPAMPLDGGRVLRAALWGWVGKVRATRIASGMGALFAYSLMFLGALALLLRGDVGGIWLLFVGWFLKEAAFGVYQQARLDEALAGLRAVDLSIGDCRALPARVSLDVAVRDYFLLFGYGGFPVEEDGRVTGLLSLADIKRVPREAWGTTAVRAAMMPLDERSSIAADDSAMAALAKMAGSGLGRLLVVDDSRRCVGLLTHGAILRRLRLQEQLAA